MVSRIRHDLLSGRACLIAPRAEEEVAVSFRIPFRSVPGLTSVKVTAERNNVFLREIQRRGFDR